MENDAVLSGYEDSYEHCQENFKYEPWNCPKPSQVKNAKHPISFTDIYKDGKCDLCDLLHLKWFLYYKCLLSLKKKFVCVKNLLNFSTVEFKRNFSVIVLCFFLGIVKRYIPCG